MWLSRRRRWSALPQLGPPADRPRWSQGCPKRDILSPCPNVTVYAEALTQEDVMKLILGVGVALLVALGSGWALGASGRSDVNHALAIAELRDDLLEGRAAVLDARLEIYSVNFGEASRHLEAARSALRAANARLSGLGRQEDVERLKTASTRI